MYIVTYHAVDADGWMSGTLLRLYLMNTFGIESSEIIKVPLNYDAHSQQNLANITKRLVDDDNLRGVYMGDITATDEYMEEYAEYIHRFDHHASRINKGAAWESILAEDKSRIYWDGNDDPDGTKIKDPTKFISACELIWMELFKEYQMPLAVSLIGRRDVWDFSSTDKVRQHNELAEDKLTAFSLGMFADIDKARYTENLNVHELLEQGYFANLLDDEAVSGVLEQGEALRINAIYSNYTDSASLNSFKTIMVPKIDKPITLVYQNAKLRSDYYTEKWLAKHPDVTISLSYYLSNGRMYINCKSLRDNAPALELWTYLEKVLKIDEYRGPNDMGGHAAACGGNYMPRAILILDTFLRDFKD